MKGQRIGYVRVSTLERYTERQREQVPVDRVFTDKASGQDTQRPELDHLSFTGEDSPMATADAVGD